MLPHRIVVQRCVRAPSWCRSGLLYGLLWKVVVQVGTVRGCRELQVEPDRERTVVLDIVLKTIAHT